LLGDLSLFEKDGGRGGITPVESTGKMVEAREEKLDGKEGGVGGEFVIALLTVEDVDLVRAGGGGGPLGIVVRGGGGGG